MTATRDPDRILRAWLELMPDEAPDRVFDAVLQDIDHTPQARRPWLAGPWRFPDMPRLFLAGAAAALAIVVGAIALIPRSSPIVGGSPAPSSTSAASTTSSSSPSAAPPAAIDVPSALRRRWMGGTNPYVDSGAGSSIVFTARGLELDQSNAFNGRRMVADASATDLDTVRLTGTTNRCAADDAGTYRWSLSPSGRVLTLDLVNDPCSSRAATLVGHWWLEGCRDINTGCLGLLDPGTYGSQYIRPILAKGETWAPKAGAVTYTVPSGWANYTDYPNSLGFATADQFAATTASEWRPADTVDVLAQVLPTDQSIPCTDQPAAGVQLTPEGFVAFLRTVPGLTVGASRATTVGSLPAIAVDLSLDDAHVRPCDGERIVGYMHAGEGQAIGPLPQRLIVTSPVAGTLTVIRIEAGDASRLATLATAAEPIVASIQLK